MDGAVSESAMTAYVGYARVSTDGQGRSGLGLEAQEATIHRHLRDGDRLLLPIAVEVESGRKADRPVLRQAIDRCRVMGATLLVAKLDRLARDAAFVRTLVRSGVPVEFADLPATRGATGTFLIGIMAEVAQLEAGLISERTRAALGALKARGVSLGGDRGHRHAADDARRYGAEGGRAAAAKADVAAHAAAVMIDEVRTRLGDGASLGAIARAMNEAGARSPRGGAWTATAVKRALARVEGAAA
jgi:DNA invertase Pin-like site-specific DNA recombinase